MWPPTDTVADTHVVLLVLALELCDKQWSTGNSSPVVGKHGQFINVIELSVALAIESNPHICCEYLSSLQ